MDILHFTKAHGLGNDFIIVNAMDGMPRDGAALARALCRRHTGVGGDGLVLACPPTEPGADIRMVIYNSDGSEAEMCGNASRCFGKYVYERGLLKKERFTVQTLSGPREMALHAGPQGRVEEVSVCLGRPRFLSDSLLTLEVLDRELSYWPVCMNVPHAVVPVDDPTSFDVDRYGAAMEWAEPFPQGTNVDFVAVQEDGSIVMRVWERGCGRTLACGTGAAASAACCARAGLTLEAEVLVRLELGALRIGRDAQGNMRMRGPAALVYEGEVALDALYV